MLEQSSPTPANVPPVTPPAPAAPVTPPLPPNDASAQAPPEELSGTVWDAPLPQPQPKNRTDAATTPAQDKWTLSMLISLKKLTQHDKFYPINAVLTTELALWLIFSGCT
jgi:hypothetical protein